MNLKDYIRRKTAGKIVLIITLLFSLPFLYLGIKDAQSKYKLVSTGLPAKGTVLRNEKLPDVKKGNNLAPVIEFTTVKGETIIYMDMIATYPPEFSAGEEVDILYNKDNPQIAKVNSFFRIWLIPVILIGISLLIFVSGYIIIRVLARSAEMHEDEII